MVTEKKAESRYDFFIDGNLFGSKTIRYVSRILILYIFSAIFRSFDLSFIDSVRGSIIRSQAFSLCYVVFGLLVWEGAVWLARSVEKWIGKEQASIRLLVLCSTLVIYGGLAAFTFGLLYAVMDIWLFNRYEAWISFREVSYNMNFGLFMFYLLILTFNGIIFYYKGWKEYQIKTERLMRENIQAKYDALRNQIDPHFFFNSLSVLTNLVYKSADLSAEYITQLAKIYRYILDKKFDNLVTIETELDFLDSYLFLIGIRHPDSIRFVAEVEEKVKDRGMIPPATLQMLVENAIKHNRFSTNEPLLIKVKSEGGFLLVSNPLRKKTIPEISSGIGLDNIRKRYELASNMSIEVQDTDEVFVVKIPIITQ
ncbi:sensor histidine kinase [Chitinophaga nivalis]|uniref:Sensor histidine kinase n=1 Tax=Chitinophaga nivalis TaxID=2991709 RepID=A0ABT3IGQ8_9BACT|nr:sensor histidine kinase [Chitinophaga nivalis]MCW3467185.1 sensor histidine kinase [Chitinophaga nivalis]MCW3483123.1 sensor histidine kinase [Chitinophaga nivalis]